MHINAEKIEIHIASLALPGVPAGAVIRAANDVPEVGKEWPEQGGVLAGVIPAENGNPSYYLIVPTNPEAENESLAWGNEGKEYDVMSSCGGLANTELLVEKESEHPAAEFCAKLNIEGFSDFYLPSRREASLMAATVPHLFEAGYFWTSTQYSAHSSFIQDFSDGFQSYSNKHYSRRVRAVRRVIH